MNPSSTRAGAGRRIGLAAFLAALSILASPGAAGAEITTVESVADSWVSSDRPNRNYGGSTTLKVDASPKRRSYLRFDVPALEGPVERATLRLRAFSSSGIGVPLHAVADNAWGERSLTYANAPSFGPAVSTSGPFSKGKIASLDATALVGGDGPVSFAVTNTKTSSKAFSSREGAVVPELVIETGPPPPPSEPPVIAAAGDIACDPADSDYKGGAGTATRCHQKAVSDLMLGRDLAAVLPLGDLQYETGQLANFQQVFDPTWGRLGDLLRPVPGNHEYGTSGAAGYFDYFNGVGGFTGPAGRRDRGYYSYDVGTWHVIALNSNCAAVGGCGPGSAQEQWLRADLAANPSDCTLAYMHHPLYSSDPRSGSSSVRPLWERLYEVGADVVLAGHHHGYERFARQDPYGASDPARGIREFVVGTGGKEVIGFGPIAPNSGVRNDTSHGVITLRLRPDGYDWSFVPEASGGFTDSGSDVCEGTAPDTVSPSAPANLTSAVTDGGVALSWKASTDNDGVSQYRILRGGEPIGTSSRATYTDQSVRPSTTYTYEAVAIDPTGNASPESPSTTITTLADGDVLLAPTDDATIRSDDPDSNFGAGGYLSTDGSPVKHFLLKFQVAGVADASVEAATLRLYATDPSDSGGHFRVVEDTAWSEDTVTWSTAPAGGDAPIASLGEVVVGSWYEVDVTSLVSGDGPVSLRVTNTSPDGADYSAGERSAELAPQLLIRTG